MFLLLSQKNDIIFRSLTLFFCRERQNLSLTPDKTESLRASVAIYLDLLSGLTRSGKTNSECIKKNHIVMICTVEAKELIVLNSIMTS